MLNKQEAECPLCKKPSSAETAPFCGRGCKDRDLLKWLGEGYQMPGQPADYADSLNLDDADG